MSQLHLSDEILMAFADGELDESVAAAVEQAMLSDPRVVGRIVGFLRSRRLVRHAFSSEVTPDVPPELHAAIRAQVNAFEADGRQAAEPGPREGQGVPRNERWRSWRGALAASIAAIAIAGVSYFAGQQGMSWRREAELVARLDDPAIDSVLNRSASGQEEDLPTGRMRVISTYRLENGSLCREFRLQASTGTADAVACRNSHWNITFVIASAAPDTAYTPSSGDSLVTAYLQSIGAGEPLLDAAEVKALTEDAP